MNKRQHMRNEKKVSGTKVRAKKKLNVTYEMLSHHQFDTDGELAFAACFEQSKCRAIHSNIVGENVVTNRAVLLLLLFWLHPN